MSPLLQPLIYTKMTAITSNVLNIFQLGTVEIPREYVTILRLAIANMRITLFSHNNYYYSTEKCGNGSCSRTETSCPHSNNCVNIVGITVIIVLAYQSSE
jgi:hypothetical protein